MVLPCTNSPRSLFDVVPASRLGVECGADGSFRTIEELRESIEDPVGFLLGPLANRVGGRRDRESPSVEGLEDPANDFDLITRQALASHADEIETGRDIRRRDDGRILEVTPVNRALLPYKIHKLMRETY